MGTLTLIVVVETVVFKAKYFFPRALCSKELVTWKGTENNIFTTYIINMSTRYKR